MSAERRGPPKNQENTVYAATCGWKRLLSSSFSPEPGFCHCLKLSSPRVLCPCEGRRKTKSWRRCRLLFFCSASREKKCKRITPGDGDGGSTSIPSKKRKSSIVGTVTTMATSRLCLVAAKKALPPRDSRHRCPHSGRGY